MSSTLKKKNFEKLEIAGVPRLARHTCVAINSQLFIFGGFDGYGTFFELAVFDFAQNTWSYPNVFGTIPKSRTNHTATAVGNKMYIFGGNDTVRGVNTISHGAYNDFFMFDTDTMTWYQLNCQISPRSGHHMASVGKMLYLYGGGLWSSVMNDWESIFSQIFCYNTETDKWTEISAINSGPITTVSSPFWQVGYFLFIYTDALYCFDTITNTWNLLRTKGNYPPERLLAATTTVKDKHCTFIFGGVFSTIMEDFFKLSWPKSLHALDQNKWL